MDDLVLNPGEEPAPCFFCGRPTYLISLNHEAPYCGRDDDDIAADLDAANALRERPRPERQIALGAGVGYLAGGLLLIAAGAIVNNIRLVRLGLLAGAGGVFLLWLVWHHDGRVYAEDGDG